MLMRSKMQIAGPETVSETTSATVQYAGGFQQASGADGKECGGLMPVKRVIALVLFAATVVLSMECLFEILVVRALKDDIRQITECAKSGGRPVVAGNRIVCIVCDGPDGGCTAK